jgi:hypothetical protein
VSEGRSHLWRRPAAGVDIKLRAGYVLDGGVTVLAKLESPQQANSNSMVRAEVAAWKIIRLLHWADLMPATALREVPLTRFLRRFVGSMTCSDLNGKHDSSTRHDHAAARFRRARSRYLVDRRGRDDARSCWR